MDRNGQAVARKGSRSQPWDGPDLPGRVELKPHAVRVEQD